MASVRSHELTARELAAPAVNPMRSHTSQTTGHRLAEAQGALTCHLDSFVKGRITPAHWAYELVHAVLAGDTELVQLITTAVAPKFDPDCLVEPLGDSGQNLMHVAALQNR
jgi:hypothetical protein